MITTGTEQRRSKGARPTETRERLLAGARTVVARDGLGSTTSRAIADAAEVNLAAITYHFGSKDELIAAALVDEVRRLAEPVLAVLGDDTDPASRLLTAVTMLESSFERRRADVPLFLAAVSGAANSPALARDFAALWSELRTRLAAEVAELRAASLVPGWVEPDAMAALVLTVISGVAVAAIVDPDGPDHRAVGGQLASLLLASREST
jgi:AcrR family transcriptional regulator